MEKLFTYKSYKEFLKDFIDLEGRGAVGVLAEDNTQHVNQITVSYTPPKKAKDPAHALLVIY